MMIKEKQGYRIMKVETDKSFKNILKTRKKIKWICISLFACLLSLSACAADTVRSVSGTDTAMGTIISWQIYRTQQGKTINFSKKSEEKSISGGIQDVIDNLEQQELSWRLDTSEAYHINARAGNENGAEMSDDMRELIELCLDVSEKSDGAFDITIRDVADLWDIDAWADGEKSGEYRVPSDEEIKEALYYTGYDGISVEGNHIYLPENMKIDLGAVGKGAALDSIREYLENEDNKDTVTAAVISIGGSILTYGTKPDNTKWRVGIVNPIDTSTNLGVLSLEGGYCVSTSGDYERYVETDGIRYHHIIDPATGYPADSGVHSVTIVSENGALSDALSTACFVLGVEKGLELAEYYQTEALFVDSEGNITMTDGMKNIFIQ
jgi:thiamine biosynthesis lipoprotein